MKLAPALESVLRQLPDAIVVTDAAGRITWVNPAFTRLCGHELDDIRGSKPGSFLQGEETDREEVRRVGQAVRERAPVEAELLNYHRDGHSYWVHLHIQPITDRRGRTKGFIAVEREATQVRRHIAALEEKVVELHQLVAELAPDQ